MGKINLEQVLVFDLECLCWSENERPEGAISEIIEVGICSMDVSNGDILKKESYIIKPKGEVSNYCQTLTGITQKQASAGMMFEHAMDKIRKDFGTTKPVFSFGDDVGVLKKSCREHRAKYPFSEQHMDIALLFHLKHRLKKNTGLVNCLKIIGEKFEGRQHSGLEDSLNTAKLVWNILK